MFMRNAILALKNKQEDLEQIVIRPTPTLQYKLQRTRDHLERDLCHTVKFWKLEHTFY